MAIMAHPRVGLPCGSVPRLLVAYLTTEAVRSKSREIELGDTLSAFMAELGEVPTGGRRGSITRVKEQTKRLFASNIACTYTSDDRDAGVNLAVADSYELWWNPKNPDQAKHVHQLQKLGERFFEEVTQNPVPVDLRALKALKKSPMALDTYCWLTYRMSYLSKPTVIPGGAANAVWGGVQGYETVQGGISAAPEGQVADVPRCSCSRLSTAWSCAQAARTSRNCPSVEALPHRPPARRARAFLRINGRPRLCTNPVDGASYSRINGDACPCFTH